MGEIKLPKRLSGFLKLMIDKEQAASTFARLRCDSISFPISARFPPFLGMVLFKRRENQNSQPVTQPQELTGPKQLLLPYPVGYPSMLGTALLLDAHYFLQAAEKAKPATGLWFSLRPQQTPKGSSGSRCSKRLNGYMQRGVERGDGIRNLYPITLPCNASTLGIKGTIKTSQ